MILISILCGLVAMIAFALSDAYSKPLSRDFGAPRTIFLRGLTLVAFLAVISIPSYRVLGSTWHIALLAVALGMAGYLPVLAFTHAIKDSPLGIIAPIAGTSPLVTIFLAFLVLGVSLHPGQWIAAVVIVLANIAISVDLTNLRQSSAFRISSGIPYAFAATIGWGLFFFCLIPFSRTLGPWVASLAVELGVAIAASLHLLVLKQPFWFGKALQPRVMANGALIGLGGVAFAVGVSSYNPGIVAALSNSTALVSILLGAYLFGEKLTFKDRVATGVMIVSVAAISIL